MVQATIRHFLNRDLAVAFLLFSCAVQCVLLERKLINWPEISSRSHWGQIHNQRTDSSRAVACQGVLADLSFSV